MNWRRVKGTALRAFHCFWNRPSDAEADQNCLHSARSSVAKMTPSSAARRYSTPDAQTTSWRKSWKLILRGRERWPRTSQKFHQTSSHSSAAASQAMPGGPFLCGSPLRRILGRLHRTTSSQCHQYILRWTTQTLLARRLKQFQATQQSLGVRESCVWVCTSWTQEDTPASEHSGLGCT